MFDRELARHEAAHFVVAWATECPAIYVDITPTGRKTCRHDERYEMAGRTFGQSGNFSHFAETLNALAGVVSDHWQKSDAEILLIEKGRIEEYIASATENHNLNHCADECDTDHALGELALNGVDLFDAIALNTALLWSLNAVRSILTLCGSCWKDAEEHLVEHGRIGFDGAHWDQGEGACRLFARWEGEDGIPEDVRMLVEHLRHGFTELVRSPK